MSHMKITKKIKPYKIALQSFITVMLFAVVCFTVIMCIPGNENGFIRIIITVAFIPIFLFLFKKFFEKFDVISTLFVDVDIFTKEYVDKIPEIVWRHGEKDDAQVYLRFKNIGECTISYLKFVIYPMNDFNCNTWQTLFYHIKVGEEVYVEIPRNLDEFVELNVVIKSDVVERFLKFSGSHIKKKEGGIVFSNLETRNKYDVNKIKNYKMLIRSAK